MRFVWRLLVLLGVLLTPAIALAQGEAAPPTLEWQWVVALAINSFAVVVAVQALKMLWREVPGGIKQIAALLAGPALLWAQSALSGALGYPIDLGPLVEFFGAGLGTGLAGMGFFDVVKRISNRIIIV